MASANDQYNTSQESIMMYMYFLFNFKNLLNFPNKKMSQNNLLFNSLVTL